MYGPFDDADEREWYDAALACTNGHLVNSRSKARSERNAKFCPDCGQPTISQCPSCTADVRGYHNIPGVALLEPERPPAYCHACGAAYPWTQAMMDAAQELLALTALSDAEREQAAKDLHDASSDNPRTKVAAVRLKQVLGRVAPQFADGLRGLVVDIASEAAKKLIFPG